VHRRNLEALATRLTGKFVVHANQVIAELGELRAIRLVGVAGRPVLARTPHPAQLVVASPLAAGTGVFAAALLGFLVEEGALVQGHA
jgi:hypothetical protein